MRKGEIIKYIKYAIGEVLLVSIGILIALQINNWNNSKELNKREVLALKEIISDLETNLIHIDRSLYNKKFVSRDSVKSIFIYMINHLENKKEFNTKLPYYFNRMHQGFGLDIKTSGFESLKSQGIDLISNDVIRSEIGSYYTTSIPEIEWFNRELRDDFYNYMLQFPRKLFKKTISNGVSYQTPHNYNALLQNNEYIESLKMYLSIYEMNLSSTKDFETTTKLTLQNIKTHLIKID